MKLLELSNKKEISKWAYYQCVDGNDTLETRELITDSEWAKHYCLYVNDIPEMRKLMKGMDKEDYYYILKYRENGKICFRREF